MSFQYTPVQRKALALLSGKAENCLLYGGSRSGKSFVLCCALVIRALKAPASRHAVIRRHFNGVRSSIGADTLPKVLRSRFPGLPCEYARAESTFRFPNGSEIQLIGLDDAARAEKILGREFVTLYFNECSELDFSAVQTALTRLAQKVPGLDPKAYFDCNPPGKSHWSYRMFVEKRNPADRSALNDPEQYVYMQLNPAENQVNLPSHYIDGTLRALSRAQQQRFLKGEWSEENAGALWTIAGIDRLRVVSAPELQRIVVAVDPAVTGGAGSDLTGIVAAGIADDGQIYVLADRSCRAVPVEWCRQAIRLYEELGADRIIAEVNNGGDLVGALMDQLDPDIPFQAVTARKSKLLRAEPVAALYEKGRVHHAGVFPDLEDQMCSYSGNAGRSPDRLDALVWAVGALPEPVEKWVGAE